jgi:hypothetical protein
VRLQVYALQLNTLRTLDRKHALETNTYAAPAYRLLRNKLPRVLLACHYEGNY